LKAGGEVALTLHQLFDQNRSQRRGFSRS
jgi:hypothetical protein